MSDVSAVMALGPDASVVELMRALSDVALALHKPLGRPVPYDGEPVWMRRPHVAALTHVGPYLADAWRSA